MLSLKNRRSGLVVCVVVLLLALATPAHAGRLSGLGSLWSWLAAWAGLGQADSAIVSSSARSDSGPIIDPLGRPTTQSDSGPEIDPNGTPSSSTGQSDQGSTIDPNGRPR